MTIPKRALKEIRTLSGRANQGARPYSAYMKITCLEMERFRRETERKSANHRIVNIDARLQEIEAEKAALLQSLGERGQRDSTTDSSAGPKTDSRPIRSGFKIKY